MSDSISSRLKSWKCHKIVQAGKIVSIPHSNTIHVENEHDVVIIQHFPGDWISKHNPQVGGYLVRYDDGYSSYSPAEAFEKGYMLYDPDGKAESIIRVAEAILEQDAKEHELEDSVNGACEPGCQESELPPEGLVIVLNRTLDERVTALELIWKAHMGYDSKEDLGYCEACGKDIADYKPTPAQCECTPNECQCPDPSLVDPTPAPVCEHRCSGCDERLADHRFLFCSACADPEPNCEHQPAPLDCDADEAFQYLYERMPFGSNNIAKEIGCAMSTIRAALEKKRVTVPDRVLEILDYAVNTVAITHVDLKIAQDWLDSQRDTE